MFDFRGPQEGDVSFVMSTWLKSLYYGNQYFRQIDKDAFFTNYADYIGKLLQQPGCFIRIACLHDDSDVILAYSVTSQDTVHFCYTKKVWRRQGLAKALCQGAKRVSQITKVGNEIRLKKKLTFNPWLV